MAEYTSGRGRSWKERRKRTEHIENREKEYERNRRSKVFYKRSESILSAKKNDVNRSVPNTRKIFPVKSVRLTKKRFDVQREGSRAAKRRENFDIWYREIYDFDHWERRVGHIDG